MQIELQVKDNIVIMGSRNIFTVFDKSNLTKPLWTKPSISTNSRLAKYKGLPGPYQPTIIDDRVFYRWGYRVGTSNM